MRINTKYIIDQLTKRLKFDARHFVTGGAWLSIPILVSYANGIIRSIAFARLTDLTVYGQYNFVLSIVATVNVLTLPGVGTALVETVARGNLRALPDAAATRFMWGILSTLLTAAAAIYYGWFQQEGELAVALMAAGMAIPFTAAYSSVQHYYTGRKRFDLSSRVDSIYLASTTILLISLLWLEQGLLPLIVITKLFQIVYYGINYYIARRETADSTSDSEMIPYGKSLTWANAINYISAQIDAVLLGATASFADVAIYRIANTLPRNTKGINRVFASLAMPKIASLPDKKIYTGRSKKQLLLLQAANTIFVIISIFLLPFLIRVLFGDEYTASIRIAQLLMISLIFAWPMAFFQASLQARKQTRTIYQAGLLQGILQIATLAIFIPLYGVVGIAISRIISRWATAIFQFNAIRKL